MPERILIIQTAFIGDAILTLPMIQAIKNKYDNSVIDVVCTPGSADIFRSSPFINEAVVFDKRGEHRKLKAFLRFGKKLKQKNYSRLFSPHRSFRTSILVLLSGIRETTGFDISALRWVYKNIAEYDFKAHEVERNLKLAGYNTSSERWRIAPVISADEKTKNEIAGFNLSETGSVIAIAPGTVWETKRYPEKYYAEIAGAVLAKGARVVFIGSKDDRQLCDSISMKAGEGCINLAGELKIPATIELLKKCLCLVCNDSAPAHMAMSSGIPAFMVYCSTVPEFGFYPYLNGSKYFMAENINCRPCGIHGYKKCPEEHFNCGEKLKSEVIISEIYRLMAM